MTVLESDRLHSWKQIAEFLGCEIRSAQRYEKSRGLPVHRVPGGGATTVFAYKSELKAWMEGAESRTVEATAMSEPAAVTTRAARRFWPVAAAVAAGLAVFLSLRPGIVSLSSSPQRLTSTSGTKYPPLMTDGVNVYYQEYYRGKLGLQFVPLAGGTPKSLRLELESPDPGVVAPDGSAMLLRSTQADKHGNEPLYLQPLPAAAAIRLGEIRAYDSAWMPDGRHIIFSNSRSVYQALRDGSDVRKLFDVPGRAYWFRWSPDGRMLRFTVYDSLLSRYSIWETPSVEFPPSPVFFGLAEGAPQCCGTWSPDGSTYYFQAKIGDFFQVFNFQEGRFALRGKATQLTSGPSNFRSPVPTRSGDGLLVLHQTQKAEITRYDAAANRWVPLFEGIPAATAAYSADGKSVAFTRYPEHSLWKCASPVCANPVRLIAASGRVTMPRWSPDGKRVACMMQTAAGRWRAGTVDADGSGGFVPLPDANAEADPVWSPSGDRIAFGATPNPDAGAQASIHIFHWRSNRIETLSGSQGLHSPAWSPDGSRMAAIRADTREVTLYDFASGRWSRPLPGIRGGYLNWSVSGHRLYFLGGVLKKDQEVMAYDPASGGVAAVTGFSGLLRPGFTFGDWLGLGPGDTPLALRDLGTEEVLLWTLTRN